MSLNININNFQSIGQASLKFDKGINLIVGPSNSGKTACIRAIETLLQNPNGSQRYLKHGEDSLSLVLEYKGNIIEFKRTKKDSKYIVNDQEYAKIGNSDLFDFLENSGFILDDKENIANIEGEWAVLFPFGKSGSELFKLFEHVFSIAESSKILGLYKSNEAEIAKQIQVSSDACTKAKNKLSAIEEFENAVDISFLEQLKNNLIRMYKQQNKLNLDINTLTTINDLIAIVPVDLTTKEFTLDKITNYVKINKSLVDLSLIAKYLKVVTNYNNKIAPISLTNLDLYAKILKDIELLNSLAVYSNVELSSENKVFNNSLILNYSKLKEDIRKVEEFKPYFNLNVDEKCFKISTISLDKYTKLNRDLITLDKISKDISILDKISDEVELPKNSNLVEYSKMRRDLKALTDIGVELKKLRDKELEIDSKIAEINKEISLFEQKFEKCSNCPLLQNTINKEI